MLRPIPIAALFTFTLGVGAAGAQGPPGGAPTAAAPVVSASIANPAISVIGWFQAVAGSDQEAQGNPAEFREAEIAFQAVVDPFTRADFFVAVGEEGVEIEEGFITWLALPGSGQAKVGQFRADFGKFNRTHPPETPFADRPLAAAAFLGEEGLTVTGASLSALLPNPADLYWEVVGHLAAAPDPEESPVFQADRRADLFALARTSLFVPLGEGADLNLGASYANAPARDELRADGLHAQLATGDLTFRWKNPRRSIYRSFLAQVEVLGERGSRTDAERYTGGFAYALYQFARQWKVGARYDWTESPGSHERIRGALALLQYKPSEFSTLSLQARRVREPDGAERDAAFFKWTFNIGPHGADPY